VDGIGLSMKLQSNEFSGSWGDTVTLEPEEEYVLVSVGLVMTIYIHIADINHPVSENIITTTYSQLQITPYVPKLKPMFKLK